MAALAIFGIVEEEGKQVKQPTGDNLECEEVAS
jgi:hypothetical protein